MAPLRLVAPQTRATEECRGEPIVDQVSYHGDSEPMGQQHRPGAAAQPHSSKDLKRRALFGAEVGVSRRDVVRRGWHRGKAPLAAALVAGESWPLPSALSLRRRCWDIYIVAQSSACEAKRG
jgi:hypothetical protein